MVEIALKNTKSHFQVSRDQYSNTKKLGPQPGNSYDPEIAYLCHALKNYLLCPLDTHRYINVLI